MRDFLGTLTLGLLVTVGACSRPVDRLIVFAAASTERALVEAAAVFTTRTGTDVQINAAASSTLARQIEAGARADVFVSADGAWMDRLQELGLLRTGTRRDLLGNELRLISPAPGFVSVAAALEEADCLAVAQSDAVPAGIYARRALDGLGLWPPRGRLLETADVRAVLAVVMRGDCAAGVVYASDLSLSDTDLAALPLPLAGAPIVYPAAMLADADPRAAQLLDFLAGDQAAAVFARYGFTRPEGRGT